MTTHRDKGSTPAPRPAATGARAAPASRPSPGAGRLRAAALGAIVLLPLVLLAWRFDFLVDDAFISFRYASNWATGHGLAYHAGAAQPVEGFSNFLWVALLAGLDTLGVSLERGARLASAVAAGALVAAVMATLRRRLGVGELASLAAGLFVSTSAGFAVWATGGLETMLFALLLFVTWSATLFVYREGRAPRRAALVAAGLCGAGVALVRVEGLAWVLAAAGAAWLARPREARLTVRELALLVGPALIAWAGYEVFRVATFGDWTANTTHAKAAWSVDTLARGARTVASFGLVFLSPLVALPVAAAGWRGPRAPVARSALALVAAVGAYNVLVGGDWMPYFRFLVPVWPFLAVALALGLERLPRPAAVTGGVLAAVLGLGAAFDVLLVPRGVREALDFRSFRTGYQTELERWRRTVENGETFAAIGHALRQVAQPEESMTCGAIGAIGYYSGMRMLDRNGLIDREVARLPVQRVGASAGHTKRVPRSFFVDRAPDYLEARLALGPPEQVLVPVARDLYAQLEREGDAALLPNALPQAFALQPAAGLPPGASLVVLRYEPDASRVQAFWSRITSPR